jgi:hypothetical protein
VPQTAEEARAELQPQLDKLNNVTPPDYVPLPVSGSFRHKCAAKRNVSRPIDLKEQRLVTTDGIWAGLFKEGKCKFCGQVARSDTMRIVVADKRPPLSGRVARD